ncbi:hypothetical protein ABW21_db0204488 [Orbilia brochopaga]|nr:hypothetical protein ABW21_db0204488 [Drechslerella brochopaga]
MGRVTSYPHLGRNSKMGPWIFFLVLALTVPSVVGAGLRLGFKRSTLERHRSSHRFEDRALHHKLEGGPHKRQVSNLGSTVMITVSSTTTVTVHMTPPAAAEEVTTTTTTQTPSSRESSSEISSISPMLSTSTSSQLAASTSITAAAQSSTRRSVTSVTSSSSVPEPPVFLSTSRIPVSSSSSSTSLRAPASSVSSSSLAPQPSFDAVVGAGNTCVDRMKIEDMQTKQPDSFNLLLLAWRDLQTAPEADDLSFFSLSRIHGAPFAP